MPYTVNRAALDNLFQVTEKLFSDSEGSYLNTTARKYIKQIGRVVPIKTASINMGSIFSTSKWRRFVGPREGKVTEAFDLTVAPIEYEDSIRVKRKDLDDDNMGIYDGMPLDMANGYTDISNEEFFSLFDGTHEQLGYDDKLLHANDHVLGDTVYDNLGTAVLTVDSLQDVLANFFGSLRDAAGKVMPVVPTHILVKTSGSAAVTAKKLFKSDPYYVSVDQPINNQHLGNYQVIEVPWLTTGTEWHLLDLSPTAIPPALFIDRIPPEITQITDPKDAFVRENKAYPIDAYARFTVAPGAWWSSYRSTGTA